MLTLGYKASAEQFGPQQVLEYAVIAEEVGFDSVVVSDRRAPCRAGRQWLHLHKREGAGVLSRHARARNRNEGYVTHLSVVCGFGTVIPNQGDTRTVFRHR